MDRTVQGCWWACDLEDWAREADSRDGTSINLAILLIDHGFSGSFLEVTVDSDTAELRDCFEAFQ